MGQEFPEHAFVSWQCWASGLGHLVGLDHLVGVVWIIDMVIVKHFDEIRTVESYNGILINRILKQNGIMVGMKGTQFDVETVKGCLFLLFNVIFGVQQLIGNRHVPQFVHAWNVENVVVVIECSVCVFCKDGCVGHGVIIGER